MNPFAQSIDLIASEAIESGMTPSLSVVVWKEGAPPLVKAYGMANPETKEQANVTTLYQVGSLTKTFTALAILQLVEQKKLLLDQPLNPLLGPHASPMWEDLRLEHLLSHTSGIPSFTSLASFNITDPVTHQEIVSRVKDLPLQFVPGTKFDYSNSNYYLLGLVLEQVTGTSYAEILKTQIFEPAGMKSAGYCQDTAPAQEAKGTTRVKGGGWEPAPRHEMSIPFAAGALCASSEDLLHWLKALQEGTLLQPETFAAMAAPRLDPDALPLPYSLGLFRGITASRPWIGHGGDIPGFTAQASIYPDDGLSVVLLSNAGGAPLYDIETKIVQQVLGLPIPDATPKSLTTEAADAYTGVFAGNGLEIVVRQDEGKMSADIYGKTVPLDYVGEGMLLPQNGGRAFHFEQLEGTKLQRLSLRQQGMVFSTKRTKDDPPAEETFAEVPLTQEQIAPYVGQYEAALGILTLTHEQGKTRIQLTGQDAFELMHLGDHTFVGREHRHIRFVFDPPAASSPSAFVTLYQGPAKVKFERVLVPQF